jgi:hypothetical protein
MIGNDKIPKILRRFSWGATPESVPRSPANASVGAVEGFRQHVQRHTFVQSLSKQYIQTYTSTTKNLNVRYANSLKSSCLS